MSLRNEISQANQTEFVDQALFLENKSSRLFNFKNLKGNKSLRPFFLLFLALVIFILFIISRKNPDLPAVFDPAEKNVKLDPLNQRVSDLKEDLKNHDPTKQSLPFPQVDLEFNIN